ncbi:MAG: DHHA1 domain-containing protein, partial [Candidatus Marinimicrobia bacterium]|nr:DHHA1 domain-containing protein [Candidatus Neomarinimicrobiota bacterium]
VSIGDFSKELCGGTHVERTGDIGFFKITEESSLAAGVRRMVAVTGPAAVEYVGKGFDSLTHVRELLNCGLDEVAERVAVLVEQRKQLEKDLKKRRSSDSGSELKKVVQGGCTVGDYRVVSSKVEAADLDHLKSIGDTVIQLLGSGIGILGAVIEKKPTVVCVVTQDLVKKGLKANNLVKEIGAKLGGGGGGKPHLATAGGKDSKKMSEVLKKAESTFVQLLRELDG